MSNSLRDSVNRNSKGGVQSSKQNQKPVLPKSDINLANINKVVGIIHKVEESPLEAQKEQKPDVVTVRISLKLPEETFDDLEEYMYKNGHKEKMALIIGWISERIYDPKDGVEKGSGSARKNKRSY